MGPRSHERGNSSGFAWSVSPYASLQWGRVLMNAETATFKPYPKAVSELQWGRVLMNAETWTTCGSRVRGPRFNGAAFS